MKSFQVMNCIPEDEQTNYSDLQVLQSAAGYYIGTIHDDGGFKEPGSRDTNYFSKKSTAEKALAILEAAYEAGEDKFIHEIIDSWKENCRIQIQMEVIYRNTP